MGPGPCPSLDSMWTFLHNIFASIDPVPSPCSIPVQCEHTIIPLLGRFKKPITVEGEEISFPLLFRSDKLSVLEVLLFELVSNSPQIDLSYMKMSQAKLNHQYVQMTQQKYACHYHFNAIVYGSVYLWHYLVLFYEVG